MKKYEFEELKKKYCTITEAIELYDSGNHSEYNKDLLDEQLDDIHTEICEAASDIAQYLINKIDGAEDDGEKVKMTDKDLDNINYLNTLLDMACDCRAYGYSPEVFSLTKSYGNDNSFADLEFYIGRCKRSEYEYFGYREFLQLLEEYELIIED